jgi:hypothetical protein
VRYCLSSEIVVCRQIPVAQKRFSTAFTGVTCISPTHLTSVPRAGIEPAYAVIGLGVSIDAGLTVADRHSLSPS